MRWNPLLTDPAVRLAHRACGSPQLASLQPLHYQDGLCGSVRTETIGTIGLYNMRFEELDAPFHRCSTERIFQVKTVICFVHTPADLVGLA